MQSYCVFIIFYDFDIFASKCTRDQSLCVSVHHQLINVARERELFDQLLVDIVKIISCIQEAVGITADQLIGVFQVARERVMTGACRYIAVEIVMLGKKLLNHTAGENGTFWITGRACLVIARDVCPKAGGVTENGRVLAEREQMIQVIDAAAVPPISARIGTLGAGCLGIIEVQCHRQMRLPAKADHVYHVGVIVKDAEFDLTAHLYTV